MLTIGIRVFLDELLQDLVGATDHPVAPAFQVMEALVVLASGGIELFKQSVDRIEILVTHQLADERAVTSFRFVRRVLLVLFQGFAQFVGQRQLGQDIGFERSKTLAHVDQCVKLALDLGFAFFAFVEGIVRINHGGSPLRNAAMITSRGPLVRPGRSMTLAERRI